MSGEKGDGDAGRAEVLVVDDEPQLVDVYSLWLSGQHTVRTATGGHEAIEQFDEDVDVVLLDRRMPDLSGDEVLDRLEDEDADCRVVMVTAAYPDFDVVEMPFDAYLIKPVDREELLDAVDRMLTRTTYSERVQRYYVLAEKVAALEANHTETELAESDVYQELVRNLDRARERAAESFATVAEEPLSPGLFDDI